MARHDPRNDVEPRSSTCSSMPQRTHSTAGQAVNPSVVSPFATGGGGVEFEKYVGAYYLALLLLDAIPFGLPAGAIREVEFQRAYVGEPLDDLIVRAELPGSTAKLALQVKRDFSFGAQNAVFQEVAAAAWNTFTGDFTPGVDRLGFVLALYSKQVDEHFQAALAWARNSSSADDFLARIATPRLSHQAQRGFVTLMRGALDAAAGRALGDEEIWNFLRSMVLLRFDFLNDPSHSLANIVQALQALLPATERHRAPALFGELVTYSAGASRAAGAISVAGLRQRLVAAGFVLEPVADTREDLRRLRDHAEYAMRDIRGRIGTVELERVDVVTAAIERMHGAGLLEIIGPPGIGKSNIFKALVEEQQAKGPVLVLSADRISGTGWDAFAADLRLERRLPELLDALGSHPEPCVFLDGADRVTEPGARRVVNDLLRAVAAHEAAVEAPPRWRVVLTAREAALPGVHAWLDHAALGDPDRIQVPELAEEEVEAVAAHLPRIVPLLADERLAAILRNPFLLDLISDPRISAGDGEAPAVATEIEVSSAWWERVVGGGGAAAGQARRLGLLTLGERDVRAPGRRMAPQGVEVPALVSLVDDRILLRDPGRDVFRFGHDVLEEWVLYRTLDQHRDELVGYLAEVGEPLGLLRAVQLLGCFLLERGETDEWERVLRGLEQSATLAPRWRQALLGAPLLSARAGQLLDAVEPLLLAEEGRRLGELLVALRTSEVAPNPLLSVAAAAVADQPLEREALLLGIPLPQWRVWVPVLQWVIARADRLPRRLRPEITQAMLLWQRTTPSGFPLRDRIGQVALGWLREAEAKP